MRIIVPIILIFLFTIASWGQVKKPVIGISCSYPNSSHSNLRKTYSQSVINAGGLPLLIPVTDNIEVLDEILDMIDGLILSGGEDIHPSYYGEEPIEELGNVNDTRDVYDIALIKLAAKRNMPLLGICRGEQLINVAFGGSLYQDIPAQYKDSTVNHNQKESSSIATHYVSVLLGSVISSIVREDELVTNTHHHQAVKAVAPGFRVSAWACDSIPEAIETTDGRPIWGVQFHPEVAAMDGDTIMSRFFHFLVEQASIYRFKENFIE